MLFVSMICLFAVYLSATQSASISSRQKIPLEKWIIFTSGFNPVENKINPAHLVPQYIAVAAGDKRVISLGDRDLTNSMFFDLSAMLASLLDSSSTREELAPGRGEVVWNDRLNAGSYAYLKFAGDLPLVALSIYQNPSDPNTLLEGYCSEMMLIVNSGALEALCRDSAGNVAILRPGGQKAVFNNDTFKEYTDSVGGTAFQFYGVSAVSYTNVHGGAVTLPDTYPVTAGVLYSARVVCSNPIEAGGTVLPDQIRAILDRLGFNTDLLKFYDDAAKNTRTYTSPEGDLTVAADGTITYAAGRGGGLRLSGLLGVDYEEYSVWQRIKSAGILADGLPRVYCGGEAELTLGGVTREDGEVCVSFGYTIDGTRVQYAAAGDTSYEVEMRFTADALTALRIRCMSVSRADRLRSLPISVGLMEVGGPEGAELSSLEPVYSLEYTDQPMAPGLMYTLREPEGGK